MPNRSVLRQPLSLAGNDNLRCVEEEPQDGFKTPKGPKCRQCGHMMKWYYSRLHRDNGRSKVIHSYVCTNCGWSTDISGPVKEAVKLPVAA